MDRHTPMSTPSKRGNNVYMTKEAIRLKNAKHRSWNRYMVTKTAHDKNAYIRLKNNLRDLTRYLRGVFEHGIAANVK